MKYGRILGLMFGLTVILIGCSAEGTGPLEILQSEPEVDVNRWYDHINGVICYWMEGASSTFNCVHNGG